MIRHCLGLTALVALTTSTAASAARPVLQLKQSSVWNVDYADDRCRLMRQFGEGDDKMFAVFDRYGPDERFRLILAGKPVRTAVDKGTASIRFGPNEGEQKLDFYQGNLGEYPALIFHSPTRLAPPTAAEQALIVNRKKGDEWIELAPVDGARMAAIRTLMIGKPFRRDMVLETGTMRKPMEALNKCVDDLMTTWGIDVERHKMLSRGVEPLTSPEKWIVSGDYPMNMISSGQPAIVEFRLSVGADGVPASCHIQSTTRPKEFDKAVCGSLMRRAKFKPAIDAQGQPLASFYRNSVRFALP